nr:hypothetical protein [Tanacetum cinerariifolium]
MLEADDEPLYEGCQKFSTLEAATRLLNWKAECNVPEATYNQALSLFKDMLPDGNQLTSKDVHVKKMSKKMTWHHDHKTNSNKMVHPSDGKAWKHFNSTHPMFSKKILNLLIKELKTLWNDGVETYDAYRKNNFNMKATILWTVSDFPAYAMLSGRTTHDNVKARKDVELYCDRPELHMFKVQNTNMKPKASYTLNKTQLHKVSEWMTKLKFPGGLLLIALRGMIPNVVWDAITELCLFFRAICSRVLSIEDLEKLQKSIVEIICKLEIIFPPGFFDSLEHLVVHLACEALLGGPVQYRWMYLYERKLGSLKRTVGDAYMKVGENEEEFVDTYENLDVNEVEEEFVDRYDDSDDENELALFDHTFDEDEVNLYDHSSDEDEVNLSDHSSDEDEVNLFDHSLNDYLQIIINWTRYAEIMARDNNSKGRGRGRGRVRSRNRRGRGISKNIVIGSSSNVSSFGNQEDANCDNGSRSEGRGRGISGNIGIGGGSSNNVSRFGNQEDANYDNGSRSGGRGRGKSRNEGIIGTSSAFDYGSKSRGRGKGISENIGIGGSSSNVSDFGNRENANYDNGSKSGGRGRGISRNIVIGSSSNVSGFGNQEDANCDNRSRSGGKGRGISRNIGICGSSSSSSSNVSGFGSQEDANYDNGSRSEGRGRGISGNIGIGGSSSNVSGFGNQEDENYDNGSRSEERGRGISRNIGIGDSSSNVSGFGNQEDANYDNGSRSGGRVRAKIEISALVVDLYQLNPSDNAAVYKAWERVMSSRYSDILGQCRRDVAHRATMDNITVGNDLSVLKLYTPSWIDQAHWDNMIDRLWNTSRWKKVKRGSTKQIN